MFLTAADATSLKELKTLHYAKNATTISISMLRQLPFHPTTTISSMLYLMPRGRQGANLQAPVPRLCPAGPLIQDQAHWHLKGIIFGFPDRASGVVSHPLGLSWELAQ